MVLREPQAHERLLGKVRPSGVGQPPSAVHAQVRTPVPPGLFIVLREPRAHERLLKRNKIINHLHCEFVSFEREVRSKRNSHNHKLFL
jgi:hypothetical protein